MTQVAEDRHGLYVMVEQRVGRPAPGQGAGLSRGAHVRAALLDGAVRVRYGGREELWVAASSRRANATGEFTYAVGQLYKTRDAGHLKVVSLVLSGGAYENGYRAQMDDGYYRGPRGEFTAPKNGPGVSSHDLVQLVRDVEPPPPAFDYELGQVYVNRKGNTVTIQQIFREDASGYVVKDTNGVRYGPAGQWRSKERWGSPAPADLVRLVA